MRVDCVGARGSEREGETSFSLSERLRLRATPKGLRAEMVNIRSLPAEHDRLVHGVVIASCGRFAFQATDLPRSIMFGLTPKGVRASP